MKRKSKQQSTEQDSSELTDERPQELEIRKEPEPTAAITENRILTPPGLQDIRSHMSNHRASTAQTIAELETWRAEIDATIAFLRGDKQHGR